MSNAVDVLANGGARHWQLINGNEHAPERDQGYNFNTLQTAHKERHELKK